jgi:polyhydroxyalkanoate synthesis regulator phasin
MPEGEKKQAPAGEEGGVTDALRAAIDRTLAATAPAAGQTRERAGEIVDEISKRGQEARDELARRGQEAGAEIARLGQEARDALSRRGLEATGELRSQLEVLEKRLAFVEERLKSAQGGEQASEVPASDQSKPKAEG